MSRSEAKTMFEYKGYIGTVEADNGTCAGRVIGLRDVIAFEGSPYAELEQAFRDSVEDHLAFRCALRSRSCLCFLAYILGPSARWPWHAAPARTACRQTRSIWAPAA